MQDDKKLKIINYILGAIAITLAIIAGFKAFGSNGTQQSSTKQEVNSSKSSTSTTNKTTNSNTDAGGPPDMGGAPPAN
ncbi:MAG: hypothetical protein PHW52_00315 [Candidatus Pacebacteria bacterium]|nr:hypothetical protein [Candidatus Paceibacterota bacterium]